MWFDKNVNQHPLEPAVAANWGPQLLALWGAITGRQGPVCYGWQRRPDRANNQTFISVKKNQEYGSGDYLRSFITFALLSKLFGPSQLLLIPPSFEGMFTPYFTTTLDPPPGHPSYICNPQKSLITELNFLLVISIASMVYVRVSYKRRKCYEATYIQVLSIVMINIFGTVPELVPWLWFWLYDKTPIVSKLMV